MGSGNEIASYMCITISALFLAGYLTAKKEWGMLIAHGIFYILSMLGLMWLHT